MLGAPKRIAPAGAIPDQRENYWVPVVPVVPVGLLLLDTAETTTAATTTPITTVVTAMPPTAAPVAPAAPAGAGVVCAHKGCAHSTSPVNAPITSFWNFITFSVLCNGIRDLVGI